MKQPHVVLRTVRSTRDPFLGPSMAPTSTPAASNLIVGVEELDSRDVSRLTMSADVVGAAPSMPMRLIEPKNVSPAPQPAAPGVAWGVKAVKADASPFTGDGMVVAVLDTGIDATHPAFQGVEIVQKDFTGEGNGDTNGHGTHCAGTIFGRDVNGLRIGVAPGVKKALIGKVLGNNGGSSIGIISAIQWALDSGANVISMSLGIDFTAFQASLQAQGVPGELATSMALEGYRANVQLFASIASVVKAMGGFSRVSILVAAAGNESQRDVNPDFEIAVSPPAVAEGFISVAALGRSAAGNSLVVAPFSNTGANVAGPGVDIVSAEPGGGLTSMSGTSMATPHVAGLAALWGQQLRSIGAFNGVNLTGRLMGAGGYADIQPGFDPSDVGVGLLVAPQA